MSLEHEVPPRELCQRWKEIGGRQDTNLFWVRLVGKTNFELMQLSPDGNMVGIVRKNFLNCYELSGLGEIVSAPLASEMLEWLPDGYSWERWNKQHLIKKPLGSIAPLLKVDQSLPNALLQMCIWRKEREGK